MRHPAVGFEIQIETRETGGGGGSCPLNHFQDWPNSTTAKFARDACTWVILLNFPTLPANFAVSRIMVILTSGKANGNLIRT